MIGGYVAGERHAACAQIEWRWHVYVKARVERLCNVNNYVASTTFVSCLLRKKEGFSALHPCRKA